MYSALAVARHVVGADAAVVVMGPGIVGTGTRLGFSGIEVGPGARRGHRARGRPDRVPPGLVRRRAPPPPGGVAPHAHHAARRVPEPGDDPGADGRRRGRGADPRRSRGGRHHGPSRPRGRRPGRHRRAARGPRPAHQLDGAPGRGRSGAVRGGRRRRSARGAARLVASIVGPDGRRPGPPRTPVEPAGRPARDAARADARRDRRATSSLGYPAGRRVGAEGLRTGQGEPAGHGSARARGRQRQRVAVPGRSRRSTTSRTSTSARASSKRSTSRSPRSGSAAGAARAPARS